jgi:SAM-dependent methyltransferase
MILSLGPLREAALVATIVLIELRTAVRVHGAHGTAIRSLRRLRDLLTRGRGYRNPEGVADGFDETHGVQTRIVMDLPDLYDVKRRGGEEHTPTPAATLRRVLPALDVRYEDTVFVDLGSGAGRAVLLAAEQPFKAIIGVEISAALHRLAEANVRSYRNPAQRCHDIRLHCGDAAGFTLPADPLVLYLYNPFRGEVMRRVLGTIERSLAEHPRPVTIVHAFPRGETRALFAASRLLTTAEDGADVAIFRSRVPPPPGVS